jgi:8-oxo-dGTP diphosphatase
MDLRLNANAIIENDKGEVLAIKLKKGFFSGRLSLPGGGINAGETGEETIIREIEEETGIKIREKPRTLGFCEIINSKFDSHRVVLLFYCRTNATPIETEEGIPSWKKVEEIQEEGIPFAKETLRIWKARENYFKILE